MRKGIFYAFCAYALWGFFPIYWKWLDGVPPIEILSHRMVWAFMFCVGLLAVTRNWSWVSAALHNRNTVVTVFFAAVLLSINWFTYIWGVNSGFIVETSLGYFINPLVNVVLGVLIFKERLRPGQWAAVVLAALGVLFLTAVYGRPPWIALTLAFSFGFYGVLKKKVQLPALEGLSLETGLLFVFALSFLLWRAVNGNGSFGHSDVTTDLLLIGTGIITAVPLLSFAAAAHLIPLSLMGIMQYIAPTFQFMIGVFIFDEPFSPQLLVGFSIIWTALALYTLEGVVRRRRKMALGASAD
ncbi:MAG: EamA family transporter RarD [Anaerolineae bacterium]|nr:EamA family transporter RarD [Anaerolineae bacterium]